MRDEGQGDQQRADERPRHESERVSDAAKAKARDILENRLSFFSPQIRSRIETILKEEGGIETLRVAFWGQATRAWPTADDGISSLAMARASCAIMKTPRHIHMSMKGKLATENPAK